MKVFRLQNRCRQKICPTDRSSTMFGKTGTPYSIASTVCFFAGYSAIRSKNSAQKGEFSVSSRFSGSRGLPEGSKTAILSWF